MAKTKLGKMACESCGEPVTVRENERGTLSYRCEECDAAPYARSGTGQHANWLAKLQKPAGAAETGLQQGAASDLKPAAEAEVLPDLQKKPAATGNIWGFAE